MVLKKFVRTISNFRWYRRLSKAFCNINMNDYLYLFISCENNLSNKGYSNINEFPTCSSEYTKPLFKLLLLFKEKPKPLYQIRLLMMDLLEFFLLESFINNLCQIYSFFYFHFYSFLIWYMQFDF